MVYRFNFGPVFSLPPPFPSPLPLPSLCPFTPPPPLTSFQSECIRAKDLHLWAESLPNAHVTFLFGTHQNHVAQFGKHRSAKVAEIMTDPWGELTSAHSSTVVYYLRPDPTSMSRIGREEQKREEGEWNELGLLTECFVSALINCYKR